MKTTEILAKTIITESNLPAADYVVNPYAGCSHACIYCYARFMKRFSGHEESWGRYVDVKVNGADLVPDAGGKRGAKYAGKALFMSSVTDPYLPLEKKYRLTRSILEKLVPLQPALGIQTKSDLIVRDIDILSRFGKCEAGLTVTTLDDSVRAEVEPGAASVARRIAALEELKKAGLRTYVFIGPIFPALTDWRAIIEATRHAADFYYFENLNVSGSIRGGVREWLEKCHPELLAEYGRAYAPGSRYWDAMEGEIASYCAAERIDGRIFFHHGK